MAQRVSGVAAWGLWGLGFSAGTCRTWPCACAPSNIPLQTAPCLRPASGLPASRWCRSGSAWHPAPPGAPGSQEREPTPAGAGPPAGAPGTATPAAPWCPPHSLFEPVLAASVSSRIPRLLCRSPVFFLHYITSAP